MKIACENWEYVGSDKGGKCRIDRYANPSFGVCLHACKLGVQAVTVSARPAVTAVKVATFARAMITGEYVDPQIVEARIAICSTCEFRKTDAAGVSFCGICGCSVSPESRKLTNLAAYQENLPAWGCKHPNRKNGAGWPSK